MDEAEFNRLVEAEGLDRMRVKALLRIAEALEKITPCVQMGRQGVVFLNTKSGYDDY